MRRYWCRTSASRKENRSGLSDITWRTSGETILPNIPFIFCFFTKGNVELEANGPEVAEEQTQDRNDPTDDERPFEEKASQQYQLKAKAISRNAGKESRLVKI